MTPLVSVVIPALNARPWIDETLQSVLTQSHSKASLEVVVVDDGSSDGTGNAATAQLESSGIRHCVLRNPTPTGPSAARNRGWRSSSGTWIQFLDADDVLEPDKIERQLLAVRIAGLDVAAVFSPWGYLMPAANGGWLRGETVAPTVGSDPLQDVLRAGNFLATGSLLFSRAWIEQVDGYVESHRLIEDVDLLMRLVMRGGALQAVPSERPTFWYRQLAHSLSRENHSAFVRACLRNLKAAEAHWRAAQHLTSARAEFLADSYFALARFFAEHDPAQFEWLLDVIYGLNPEFVPSRPPALKRASQIVGYRRAEHLAIHYRRLKRFFRPLLATQ